MVDLVGLVGRRASSVVELLQNPTEYRTVRFNYYLPAASDLGCRRPPAGLRRIAPQGIIRQDFVAHSGTDTGSTSQITNSM